MTVRAVSLLAALLLVVAAAGCGGSSGPGTGGGAAAETEAGTLGSEGEAPGVENDPIYIEAGNICVNLPLDVLAQQYGVEAEKDAVAIAVAAEYPEADRDKAKQGCLASLDTEG